MTGEVQPFTSWRLVADKI